MFDNNQQAQLSVMLKKLPTAVTFDSREQTSNATKLFGESRLALVK